MTIKPPKKFLNKKRLELNNRCILLLKGSKVPFFPNAPKESAQNIASCNLLFLSRCFNLPFRKEIVWIRGQDPMNPQEIICKCPHTPRYFIMDKKIISRFVCFLSKNASISQFPPFTLQVVRCQTFVSTYQPSEESNFRRNQGDPNLLSWKKIKLRGLGI